MYYTSIDAVLNGMTYTVYTCSLAYVLTHVLNNKARNVVVAMCLMVGVIQWIEGMMDSGDNSDDVAGMIATAFITFAQLVSLFIVLEKPNPAACIWACAPILFIVGSVLAGMLAVIWLVVMDLLLAGMAQNE